MKYIVVSIINIYQATLGLYMRGACKFSPTCSEYMKQAILKYGIVRGFYLACRRLMKCHPYSKHFGIDVVKSRYISPISGNADRNVTNVAYIPRVKTKKNTLLF